MFKLRWTVILLILLIRCQLNTDENKKKENDCKIIVFFDCINDKLIEKDANLAEIKSDFQYYINKFILNRVDTMGLKILFTSNIHIDTIVDNCAIKISFDTSINYVGMAYIYKQEKFYKYGIITNDEIYQLVYEK